MHARVVRNATAMTYFHKIHIKPLSRFLSVP